LRRASSGWWIVLWRGYNTAAEAVIAAMPFHAKVQAAE
jgi:hypothetical protein